MTVRVRRGEETDHQVLHFKKVAEVPGFVMCFKSVENSSSQLTIEVLIKLIFLGNDFPNVSGYQVAKILSGL